MVLKLSCQALHDSTLRWLWGHMKKQKVIIAAQNSQTIALISSRNFKDGHSKEWWKKGHINR